MSKGKSQFKAFFEAKETEETPSSVVQEPAPQAVKQKGKHRHPDYTKTAAYIRSDTYRKVKTALISEEKEYSELVEVLLEQWLAART